MADTEEIPNDFDASNRAFSVRGPGLLVRQRRVVIPTGATCTICGDTIGCWRRFEDQPPTPRLHWQREFRASKSNLLLFCQIGTL